VNRFETDEPLEPVGPGRGPGAEARARAWIEAVSVAVRVPAVTLVGSADLLYAGRDRVIELLHEIEMLDAAAGEAGDDGADEVFRALYETLTTARHDPELVDRHRSRGRVAFSCLAVNKCPMAGWCSGPGHDICPLELYAANRSMGEPGGPG
jgi:hypothetical protein